MLEKQSEVSAKKSSTNSITAVICVYTEDRWVTLRRAIDVVAEAN